MQVRYTGNEPLYSRLAHENSKTDREFVRACPSVIQQIKKDFEIGISPLQIIDNLNAANRARDFKYVKTIATRFKSAKQLTKHEIYNLILLGYHLDGFVHKLNYFLILLQF